MSRGTDVTQETWIYYLERSGTNPHVDPEAAAEIHVEHIEDSHITGGVMRATRGDRSRTRWGSKSKGPDLKAGSYVLGDALKGEFDG